MLINLSVGKRVIPLLIFSLLVDGEGAAISPRINNFGLALFSELLAGESNKNILISPPSIAIALIMTYNGAEGETKQAMAKTLGLEGIALAQLNQEMKKIHQRLKSRDEKIKIEVANSLWARKGISFRQDFLKRNKEFFSAEIKSLDFSQAAIKEINRWVEKKTKGKIREIIEKIEGNAVLFLINAIYFKGKWQKEFAKNKTKEDIFFGPKGPEKVFMMNQSGRFPYLKKEICQAVSLPYGKGDISIYLFLPDTNRTISELVQWLKGEKWEDLMGEFREMEGDISLPRFQMEYEKSLKDVLKEMDMAIAFDPYKADFTGMRKEGELFINDVRHKTFIKVDEEGTEAAGATSVEIALTAVPDRFSIVFNRPFFFALQDNRTGLLLFTGIVSEPNE
ncbi:MAG: serpin family protein [candidate division WOR-3 bacterium]